MKSGNERTHYNIEEAFDPRVGLFIQENYGHTIDTRESSSVHNVINSSTRLLIAAQLGTLDSFPGGAVLTAIRRSQHLIEDGRYGCIRWYWEDSAPHDTNAAFFAGLNMIVLKCQYADALSTLENQTLTAILRDLATWFDRHTHSLEYAYYPNKFLGDLVCAWLLREIHGRCDDADAVNLLHIIRESAVYWRDYHWGWGEHLSDPYAAIMLDQLSALLLLSRKLPEDIRALYLGLFKDLLRIDDVFFGGPRVPTIRNYLFGAPAPHVSYRDTVRWWTSAADACLNREEIPHMFKTPYGRVFSKLGWHELAGFRAPLNDNRVSVKCLHGACAEAWIGNNARLGVMTRYPIMLGCDEVNWGLSWQSMPVAFATAQSWSFLRWHTVEAGIHYHHPARDKHAAYRQNALTNTILPPITGQTRAYLDGSRALILRVMPAIALSWQLLADELVLTGASSVEVSTHNGVFTRLRVRADEQTFTIYAHALGSNQDGEFIETDGDRAWRFAYNTESLTSLRCIASVWCIAVGDSEEPVLKSLPIIPNLVRQPNQRPCRITWGSLTLDLDPALNGATILPVNNGPK
jgi:hypothetical protein